MLIENDATLRAVLACPACGQGLHDAGDGRWACPGGGCATGGAPFDRVNGKSMLVDFGSSVLQREAMLASGGASTIRRGAGWRERFSALINGTNGIAPHFAGAMVAELERTGKADGRRPSILIVGGGAVGSGSDALYASPDVDIVSFDIYWSQDVTFLADAHAMPLADASVDAVWIQAVLEHVANPIDVVAEIRRVLRPGGLVFADTPFMWPVHEKAYDFTRWTPSGHRWLFRDFDVIAAGTSSGPGTLFVLSLRYLFASLFRNNKVGHLAALPFFWVRFLDRFCDARRGLDAAAGIFFYGRKSDTPLGLPGLIAFYDQQVPLERQVPGFRRSSAGGG
ncbi:MAG: class I SAM-dependent methyltransferase [Sphingobium sp.]|nr:MAG: class I SAM-dependent methyltransferase [Sphingobium sp.]